MIVVLDARLSHRPEHVRPVHAVITTLDRLAEKHTWLVPDPERWGEDGHWRGIPYLDELFRKAATAALNVPAGSLWVSMEGTEDVVVPGWGAPFTRVRPSDRWCDWLSEPLYVVVEDADRDASFVRSMAVALSRGRITDGAKTRMIEFRHAGGGLLAELQRLRQAPYRRRIVVLADSDRDAPSSPEPPQKLQGLVRACRGDAPAPTVRDEVALWILRRRAIENYLPLQALRWYVANAEGHFKRTQETQRRLEQLLVLWERDFTEDQRSFFHVKDGLKALKNPKALPANQQTESQLLASLLQDPAHGDVLRDGFLSVVATCWSHLTDEMQREWFTPMSGVESEFTELCELIEALL